MNMRRHLRALVAVGLLGIAACGGDDDSSDEPEATTATTATEATDAPATTIATSTTGGATADPVAYCDAHLGIEAAIAGGDPAAFETAVDAAHEVIPAEIADALHTAVANAPTEPGPPDPTFAAAYGELVGWVRDNCGYTEVNVLGTDYAFSGLDDELPAGPTIVELTNEGAEFHEIVLMRKAPGVTESFDELLALPEEEVGDKAIFVGAATGAPGETAATVVDLTAGEYLAVCFVPTGATPEVLAAGPPPDAEPHFAHGMKQEFTVA